MYDGIERVLSVDGGTAFCYWMLLRPLTGLVTANCSKTCLILTYLLYVYFRSLINMHTTNVAHISWHGVRNQSVQVENGVK